MERTTPPESAAPTRFGLKEVVRRLTLHNYGARFWLVDLTRELEAAELAGLSAAERGRAARFVFPEHRRRFATAHAALRWILAAELDIPAAHIEYRLGAHDKPALAAEFDCVFNMSHSDELALIAIARGLPEGAELGVDLEALRTVRNVTELAAANFTPVEQAELARSASDARDRLFLSGWTRKEACLKALGSGLSIAPASFECALAPIRTLTRVPTPVGLRTVEVESIEVRDTHLAAVAITVPAADR